jgi:PAS domain S-box-containing protein
MSSLAFSSGGRPRAASTGRRSIPGSLVHAILTKLCGQLEDRVPGMCAGIYVLDPGGWGWERVIEPHLPPRWHGVHRVPTGRQAGACGAAIAREERVIVTDVTADPLYAEVPRAMRYACSGACWATPFLSGRGRVLGVLVLYGRRGRVPRRAELRAMDYAAELGALVLEQRRQTRRLRTELRRWRAAVDGAPLAMALLGTGGGILGLNRRYHELLGYAETEFLEARPYSQLDTHERARALRDLRALQRGELSEIRTDRSLLRRDGMTIRVRATTLPLGGRGGRRDCWLELLEPIGEVTVGDGGRHPGDERSGDPSPGESEGRGVTGSWIMDLRTGLLLWSGEMFRIFGLPPDTPTPTLEMVWAQVHPEDAGRVRAAVEGGIREAQEIQGEYRLIRPDRSVARVQYWGRPVIGTGGDLVEYVGTVRDVTEERRVRQQLHATLEQVRTLAVRQLQARDDERRRIAREIHETTVQKLAAVQLSLAALKRGDGAAGWGESGSLDECAALVDSSITDLRTLSYLLHPPLLDEAGLGSAVRWYAAGFAKRSGVAVRVEVSDDLRRFPQEVEIALFRLVQECLINILRHAHTATAAVRLRTERGRLVAEVQDWGRGMPAGDGERLGVGLSGMRERIEQLGGVLQIRSGGDGTTISAVLPGAPIAS